MEAQENKPHRKPHSGPSAVKKKRKNIKQKTPKNQNKKAFAFKSSVRAARSLRHTLDIETKRHHIPVAEQTYNTAEVPPYIVAVVGPPKVGKSTLIRSLVKNYTRHNLRSVIGPITIVSGRKRRLTFIEVDNDMCCMIDVAKIADLCLLLIDASFGFEIETFEFINILQVHGFPQVMGVLTHLDLIPRTKTLRRAKKDLRHRFWTEIYQGAKVFYLSGILNGDLYPSMEVHNLSRFISVMRFHPTQWRLSHAFFLADRVEDLTPFEDMRLEPSIDRNIALYGYIRGTNLPDNSWVHIPGCGDYRIGEIKLLQDPCPLPGGEKKRRNLNEKQKLIYAPKCGIGQLSLDNDAIYVDLPSKNANLEPSNDLISAILRTNTGVDEKLADADGVMLFENSEQVCDIESEEKRESSIASDTGGEENRENSTGSDSENDLTTSESDSDSEISQEGSEKSEENNSEFQNASTQVIKDGYTKLISTPSWTKMYNEYLDHRLGRHSSLQELIYSKKDTILLRKQPHTDDLLGDLFIVNDNRKQLVHDSSYSRMTVNFDFNNESTYQELKNLFVTGRKRVKFRENSDDNREFRNGFIELDDDGNEIQKLDNFPENEFSESESENIEKEVVKKQQIKSDYFKDLQQQTNDQDLINKGEYEQFDILQSAKYIGYPPGSYIRISIDSIPYEFINNTKANSPIIVGSLTSQELETTRYTHARVKQHRWHKKVLKTRDPIIVSLGWRRFQTLPVYYTEEHNKRKRMLKYTPEHSHCHAVFNAPVTHPGTGLLALQVLTANAKTTFRIALTGVLLENSQTIEVVKKLKLTGTPYKIYKNTAFIKGMFNSALEVAKFERSIIQTVSGIRGIIKRNVSKPSGHFRASFEDKILMSDIVFLRVWHQVELPLFYNPVCNHVDRDWNAMKTVAEIRHENNTPIPVQKDSLYQKVERITPKFAPLKIPHKLEKDLPFKSKPKYVMKSKGLANLKKPAVILEPNEQKVMKMFQQLRTAHNDNLRKRKIESLRKSELNEKMKKKVELKRLQSVKKRRRDFYTKVGKKQARSKKKN
ncbi:Bms1l protein [Oopsacas minuta]|uniref:Bms1l protein n=1 Tax=Oopsacas minuta TaxID=111878 RepID=A0AAV7JEB9_9METZ|nr:Bms1l protein [Oopsacas minuta]